MDGEYSQDWQPAEPHEEAANLDGPLQRLATRLIPKLSMNLMGGAFHQDAETQHDDDDSEVDDDGLIPFSRANPKLKLETISSDVMNVMLVVWAFVYATSIGLLIFSSVAANTYLKYPLTYCTSPSPVSCKTVDLVWTDSNGFLLADIIIRLILVSFILITAVIFGYHLLKTEARSRVLHQYLVLLLAVFAILSLFPWRIIHFAVGGDGYSFDQFWIQDAGDALEDEDLIEQAVDDVSTVLSVVFSGLFLLYGNLYVWIKARALCARHHMRSTTYFWPTAVCLLNLLLYYMGHFGAKVVWNPGVAYFLANIIHAGVIGVGEPYIGTFQFIVIMSNTILSVYILGAIFLWFHRTSLSLKDVSYSIFRSEHVAFHFFRSNFLQFFIFSFITSFVQTFSTPLDFQSLIPMSTGVAAVISWQHDAASLVLVYFVIVEIITVLPVRAADPLQCWKTVTLDDWKHQRIRIRKHEESTENGEPTMNPKVFVLDTITLMMNFCMLAYDFTNDEVNLEHFKDKRFQLVAHIQNKELDTHVAVFESDDRIVVAFRGTKSKVNVKSDLQATSLPLSSILETKFKPVSHDSLIHLFEEHPEVVYRLKWLAEEAITIVHESERRARVHSGFGLAYQSVGAELICLVAGLLEKKDRPVFVAGHSLGGAMATLHCFHLAKVLPRLVENRLCLVTCGSPRVGNAVFHRAFSKVVMNYWRIAFSGDPIPKVPATPFYHVGSMVIMRADAEIILDPSKVEKWNSKKTGIVMGFHRMWSYRKCMELWCALYVPGYIPFFWKPANHFPPDIEKLFSGMEAKAEHVKLVRLKEYFASEFSPKDKFVPNELNLESLLAESKRPVVNRWLELMFRLAEMRAKKRSKASERITKKAIAS